MPKKVKRFITIPVWVFYFLMPVKTFAAAIVLNSRDAVVWLERQSITGKLDGFFTSHVTVYCNNQFFQIPIQKDSTFSFTATLQKGENKLHVEALHNAQKISSPTVTLTLGYNPEPVIKPYAVFGKQRLTLRMNILKNPWRQPMQYLWLADARNPAPCVVQNKNSAVAVVHLPAATGIYYFNLQVYTPTDTATFRTYIIKRTSGIQVFDMDKTHAPWIDTSVLYEIAPSAFVSNGTYDDITAKLDELKRLGITAIWLQPVYATFRKGQGYDVTDYFSLRDDFGTEQQLRKLIVRARQLQLKVLFDFVPNHTSIQHPYAQDCIKHGSASHYYSFYQHQNDGAPYSSFYKKDTFGFINYFWEDLVNLDFNNEEVQQWVLEACKYWIKKFDIDGYRFDAVWGLNARTPAFSKRLQTELKSLKPELFLLAEDKGSVPAVYRSGFDAAYDWAADTGWVSHWSWQYKYDAKKNFTVFNHPDKAKGAQLLQQALFSDTTANLRLRFMENNDLPRFIKTHSLEATQMAAGLLFSVPGIPMLYNGQEIGCVAHPYSKHGVFKKEAAIQALDSRHLFPFYQNLIALRKKYPALQSSNLHAASVSSQGPVVAFYRWTDNEMFLIAINLDSLAVTATVALNKSKQKQEQLQEWEDVLKGEQFYSKNSKLEIPLEGYGIRWLRVK